MRPPPAQCRPRRSWPTALDLAAPSIDHSQSAAALPVKLIPVAKWSATALNHQCLFPEILLLLKLPCCRQGWQGKDILV